MNQAQKDNPTQTATERAEELFNRMGHRFGYLTALAGQRLQNIATSIRNEADRLDEPQSVSGDHSNGSASGRSEEAYQQVTAKAEQMVGQAEQRINLYASMVSLKFQKALARTREEVEDMWAEAQSIRQQDEQNPR